MSYLYSRTPWPRGSVRGYICEGLGFFILNKNRHEEHKRHAIIFMCDKKCQSPFLDRDDGIRQRPPSQFQKQTHGLFFIRVLSEKKHFELRT